MEIIPAQLQHLPAILDIYDHARTFMAQAGNPTQWGDGYPQKTLLEEDIALGRLWVAKEGETLHCAFVFCPGPEPIYEESAEACWPDDGPYWVIHRIASAGLQKGVGAVCIQWCLEQCASLRIDTHPDNLPMQHTLEKCGFCRCGRVYYGDSPRVAFQKYGALYKQN